MSGNFRDWYRVRPGYWFRPRMFGWGATPVTWQGWLVVLGFVAVAIPVAWLAKRHGVVFLALLIPPMAVLLWLCSAKTDGGLGWHWGPDTD